MRLIFFVEGQTEQEYVSRVLAPHLATFGVFADRPTLPITGRKRGKVYKGGGDRFMGRPRLHLENLLKQHRGNDVRFTTMFDLYGLYEDFPQYADTANLRYRPYDRVERLEAALLAEYGDPRLIPYIQVHEFEALLLCDSGLMGLFLDSAEPAIATLQRATQGCDSPELVNDGEATSPSYRIKAVFPDFDRLKTTVGVDWAACLPLSQIRSLCPHFNQWLTRLESLGAPTG